MLINNETCKYVITVKSHVGVSGIRIPDSYLQQLLLDHSPSPRGELSCANSTDIRCYFVDFSGYILASNQPRADVSAGDFLGRVDDQVRDIVSGLPMAVPSLVPSQCCLPILCYVWAKTTLVWTITKVVYSPLHIHFISFRRFMYRTLFVEGCKEACRA